MLVEQYQFGMSPTSKQFLVSMLFGGVVMSIGFCALMREEWKFESAVRIGMTKAEILKRVGEPDEIFFRGDVLSKWGGHLPTKGVSETWVYRVYPKSITRFVLVFSEESLSECERQYE